MNDQALNNGFCKIQKQNYSFLRKPNTDKKVILLGAGTSVKEGIEKGLWEKIKGKNIWSLNSMYKIMPYYPSRVIWVDRKFFTNNITELQTMAQKHKVKLIAKKNDRYNIIPEIKQYEVTREITQYNPEKKILYSGRMGLVGLFAISLALYENYDIIYLLGYDWGSKGLEDTRTHVYQDKIKDLHNYSTGAGRPVVYFKPNGSVKDEVKDFNAFIKYKNKIINVSPNSHIDLFRKENYDEFFGHLV